MHADAVSVQFPSLDGLLPGFGVKRPNDWGFGFEIRAPSHRIGPASRTLRKRSVISVRAVRSSGIDPVARLALVVLTGRDFGIGPNRCGGDL